MRFASGLGLDRISHRLIRTAILREMKLEKNALIRTSA
jgi:hypothetical protein